ncbi:MAG TPA: thioesterase domain-containing protein [Glycomyces sp.]|nr:thioesterase domain-containing protein [Glycomyces sp.]
MPATDPSTAEPTDVQRRRREASLSESKRALLAALRAQRTGTAADEAPPELLRPGGADAIVLVHPVGGDVFCYRELVRLLPDGPAVYGLGADSRLTGQRPPELEDLAAGYLRRLEVHGVAPTLLAGWSFGGIVAYEMTAQLHAGERDCELATIDIGPVAPDAPEYVPTDAELLQAFLRDLLASIGHRFDPADFDPALWRRPGALAAAGEQLDRRGIRIGLSPSELDARLRRFTNAARALAVYRPQRLLERFWRLTATATADDPEMEWWREGPKAVPSIKVPGDHFAMLRHPAVVEVARLIADAHAFGRRLQGAPR